MAIVPLQRLAQWLFQLKMLLLKSYQHHTLAGILSYFFIITID